MAKEADAIAAGDLTRRVEPTEGDGEIARLGRALNGMLAQIETAFAQRALSEDRLRSFLADASHELRTPLTSIRGYAELLRKDALRRRCGPGPGPVPDREGGRPDGRRSSGTWPSWPGRARAPSRPATGSTWPRWPPRPWPTPGPSTPPGPSSSTPPARSRWPATTPGWSRWSTTCWATPWPTRPRAPRSRSGWPSHGGRAVLEVRDRGPGMSPDQASHVFDRFYRGDADRLDGGSGLGLFIVASLARTFGGTATVDTEVGRGSTFEVVAARLRATAAARPTEVAQPSGRWPPLTGGAARRSSSCTGSPAPGASWDPVTDLLAAEFRVLAPDRPGYGASVGEARGLADNADLIAEFIERRAGGAGHRRRPQLGRAGWPSCWPPGDPTRSGAWCWSGRPAPRTASTPSTAGSPCPGSATPSPWPAWLGIGEVLPRLRRSPLACRPDPADQVETALPDRGVAGRRPGALGRHRRTFMVEQRALIDELPAVAAPSAGSRYPVAVVAGRWDLVVPPRAAVDPGPGHPRRPADRAAPGRSLRGPGRPRGPGQRSIRSRRAGPTSAVRSARPERSAHRLGRRAGDRWSRTGSPGPGRRRPRSA